MPRNDRYVDLLPDLIQFPHLSVSVVGVGAIGRQVALQLAAMGVGSIELLDFDTVETANLGVQGYLEADLDKSKVQATTDQIAKINSSCHVTGLVFEWLPGMALEKTVFCCVDNLDTRKYMFEDRHPYTDYFLDGRMRVLAMRLVSWARGTDPAVYLETLDPQREAAGQRCTLQSTMFTASVAAGLMIANWVNLMRHLEVPADQFLDLTSQTWTVADSLVHPPGPAVPPPAAAAGQSSVSPTGSPAGAPEPHSAQAHE